MALLAFSISCGQVEQPCLFEEVVGPSAVIGSTFGFAFALGPFAQGASQSSTHRAIEISERVYPCRGGSSYTILSGED